MHSISTNTMIPELQHKVKLYLQFIPGEMVLNSLELVNFTRKVSAGFISKNKFPS